jgi:hypothetical protein
VPGRAAVGGGGVSAAESPNPLPTAAELLELRVEHAQLAQRLANRLANVERARMAEGRDGGTPDTLPPALTTPPSTES